jgi:Fuc2NAc and GlcNAc transferase
LDNLILYLSSLTLGGAGAWFVARWGKRLSLIDKANNRSSHEGVVPKGGGIGILAAFLLASWVLGLPVLCWVCAGLISLLSLYGDRKEITPKVRLLIQFLAGIGLLVGLFYWEGRGWPVYLLIPFFAVFVVGTANYYNFMDGINGIAGITGVIGFGLLAFYASSYSEADYSLVILSICISLSCLGFLPLNMPKAKVFMGDVGSILLGFVFAAMVVLLSKSFLDFVCLAGFLFPFYADELTTLIVRIREEGGGKRQRSEIRDQRSGGKGQRSEVGGGRRETGGWKKTAGMLAKPHRRHLYQLFANEMRIDHWKVSISYGLVQLIVGISVLIVKPFGIIMVLMLLAAYFGGFVVLSFRFRKRLQN